MGIWWGTDDDEPIGEDNYKKELSIMAKVKCNHCMCKYSYKSAKSVSDLMEEVKLIAKLNITELDGKFYCKGCRQTFAVHLIDDVFIIERAKYLGMDFKSVPEPPKKRIINENVGFMKLLEKLGIVKKVEK